MNELILFAISILPVVLLGTYIYKKDKVKESPKLLVKLFTFGIISCFFTLIISGVLGSFFYVLSSRAENLNLFELFIHVFFGIALVEEFSKWIMTYKISYNDLEFDEVYDMIIYSVFVSLGFACFENLKYVSYWGLTAGIIRAVLSIPGHVFFGIFMGYFFGLAKLNSMNRKLSRKYLIYSLLVPTFLHGIYDYCLFTEMLVFYIVFLIFIVIMYIVSIKKVNSVSKSNVKLQNKIKYCIKCGNVVTGNYCSNCGYKRS